MSLRERSRPELGIIEPCLPAVTSEAPTERQGGALRVRKSKSLTRAPRLNDASFKSNGRISPGIRHFEVERTRICGSCPR